MQPSVGAKLPVLVAGGGAAWEAAALEALDRDGLALHRRCVDLEDLVATAGTGLAEVAVASAHLRGLDADTVVAVHRAGVGLVLVHDGAGDNQAEQLHRLGADEVVGADLDGLVSAVRRAGGTHPSERTASRGDSGSRTTVVLGPQGAPGRTTVAAGLAAELAHRGRSTFLLDADPYGGAVAQHLGILDEISGLLAAARAANAGLLDAASVAGFARTVAPDLRVLTGLPRADRWVEVREPAFDEILTAASLVDDHVVVDAGFSLERDAGDPFDMAPRRNGMTLAALDRADEVVMVGAADPVGLARLARALVDLQEQAPGAVSHVVVNRARPTVGWSEEEVRAMVTGFARPAGMTTLLEDRPTADRALMTGSTLVELGDGPLRRGIAALADCLLGEDDPGRRRRLRRRRTRA